MTVAVMLGLGAYVCLPVKKKNKKMWKLHFDISYGFGWSMI